MPHAKPIPKKPIKKGKKTPVTKATEKTPKVKKTAKKEVAKMPTQNGVTRPNPDTITGKVWQICDDFFAKNKKCPKRADVVTFCVDEHKINKSTAMTQYGRWCRFTGNKWVAED